MIGEPAGKERAAKARETDRRVAEILASMTMVEKAGLLAGRDAWHLYGVERLGVAALEVADCGHGVTIAHDHPSTATCFPTSVGMASTWNAALLTEVGKALGRECRALGVSILLGPMVNLHRLPVGGRNYETFSEDPLLTGKLAAALVRGVQSVGTGACIKSAVANNQQKYQYTASAEVDERTLRELYLLPFEIAIREADPCAVMTAYNKLNGEDTAACSALIRGLLKGELGFPGFVVSDWRGVHDERSIASGLDLEMPGPARHMTVDAVLRAVREGVITEADLEDRAHRLVRACVLYDGSGPETESGLDRPEHRDLARRVAEEAIVLLKNDRGLLPLDPAALRSLAVIGPNAAHARLGGGGSASVSPPYAVSPLEGIRAFAGDRLEVRFAEGRPLLGDMAALELAEGLDAEYWATWQAFEAGAPPARTATARAIDFSWGWASPAVGIPRQGYAARYTGSLAGSPGGKTTLALSWQHGGARLYVDDRLVLDEWEPRDGAMFEAAYLAETKQVEVDLAAGATSRIRVEYRKTGSRASLRLSGRSSGGVDPLEEAVELARRSDAVILCTGLSNMFEGGTQDRVSFSLPEGQDRLIRRVAEANPHTVVVLQNGTPVEMSWADEVPAVLEAWYPGQEGGTALARILFGQVSPSGRLPDTIPRRLDDLEAMAHYPGDEKRMAYGEGVFVGYRDLLSRGIEPRFPFGFGLSYTEFSYSDMELSSPVLEGPAGTVEVSVVVENRGTRAGKEVVQLYVGQIEPKVRRPRRELKGFSKVDLEPGQSRKVTFQIRARDLSSWSSDTHAWTAEPGSFEVLVGQDCSRGIAATVTYTKGDGP